MLIWAEYSGDDNVAAIPLLLSERSQSLVLAALANMDNWHHWQPSDSTEWDEIQGAVAQAYYEVSEVTMPDFTPVGCIMAFFGEFSNIPDKWLPCIGGTYNDSDYPELAAIIPSSYGGGGGGTFTVPDMRSRFLFGEPTSSGGIGALGGTNDVTLTIAQIPAHHHDQNSRGGAAGAILTSGGYLASVATPVSVTTTDTGDTGGGGSHTNIPANVSVNFIIKALP